MAPGVPTSHMLTERIKNDTPVTSLPGVGTKRAVLLKKLGILTAGDLLTYFPRAYENRGIVRTIGDGTSDLPVSYYLTVGTEVSSALIRRGMTVSKFRAFDDTGSCEVVFFNAPFVKDVFHPGGTFRFYGKLIKSKNRLQLTAPKYEPHLSDTPLPDLLPIYPLTAGISSKLLSQLVTGVMGDLLPSLTDPLPESLRTSLALPTLTTAIRTAHTPPDAEALHGAVRRLAFDEMFAFALCMAKTASFKKEGTAQAMKKAPITPLLELLPYELTDGQKAAVNDIYRDMTTVLPDGRTPPMTRILTGDVGSGKTVCAAIAMYVAVRSGSQAALMAPTEILARQHYRELSVLFGKLGIRTELILGATTAKNKRKIYAELEDGSLPVIIGTHALLSDKISFRNLGLVVTDEQHRFGVMQRAALKDKSGTAHLLVMSATPIPRTLALSMYGDLDVSRISGMPPGRQRVDTFVVDESYRGRLNDFIRKQVALGGQVYVVCPAIEPEEEDADVWVPAAGGAVQPVHAGTMTCAVPYAAALATALPDIPVEVLHGRMRPADKDAVMERFVRGETKVLVSTTVIEVGVNVPNASLMLIENADRFGLSQLHQLRGRVGRGTRKSYCVLVSDDPSEKSRARLEVMRTTYDGYEIAEKDLLLRGPGDFFAHPGNDGMRQSGGFAFRFAPMANDPELYKSAFAAAKGILTEDPTLTAPEHQRIAEQLAAMYAPAPSSIS